MYIVLICFHHTVAIVLFVWVTTWVISGGCVNVC